MISPASALERLVEGNRRFVAGTVRAEEWADPRRRGELVAGQSPFAVVLGCSDSRVPVEMVFDQGPGELFVIRVAGNVAFSSQIGSVEFAVEQLGTRLVVVLGHSGCGAVAATLEEIARPTGGGSVHLRAIVDRVRPAVEAIVSEGAGPDQATLLARAVRANARAAADGLRRESAVLAERIGQGQVAVVAAEYSLEEGRVELLAELGDL